MDDEGEDDTDDTFVEGEVPISWDPPPRLLRTQSNFNTAKHDNKIAMYTDEGLEKRNIGVRLTRDQMMAKRLEVHEKSIEIPHQSLIPLVYRLLIDAPAALNLEEVSLMERLQHYLFELVQTTHTSFCDSWTPYDRALYKMDDLTANIIFHAHRLAKWTGCLANEELFKGTQPIVHKHTMDLTNSKVTFTVTGEVFRIEIEDLRSGIMTLYHLRGEFQFLTELKDSLSSVAAMLSASVVFETANPGEQEFAISLIKAVVADMEVFGTDPYLVSIHKELYQLCIAITIAIKDESPIYLNEIIGGAKEKLAKTFGDIQYSSVLELIINRPCHEMQFRYLMAAVRMFGFPLVNTAKSMESFFNTYTSPDTAPPESGPLLRTIFMQTHCRGFFKSYGVWPSVRTLLQADEEDVENKLRNMSPDDVPMSFFTKITYHSHARFVTEIEIAELLKDRSVNKDLGNILGDGFNTWKYKEIYGSKPYIEDVYRPAKLLLLVMRDMEDIDIAKIVDTVSYGTLSHLKKCVGLIIKEKEFKPEGRIFCKMSDIVRLLNIALGRELKKSFLKDIPGQAMAMSAHEIERRMYELSEELPDGLKATRLDIQKWCQHFTKNNSLQSMGLLDDFFGLNGQVYPYLHKLTDDSTLYMINDVDIPYRPTEALPAESPSLRHGAAAGRTFEGQGQPPWSGMTSSIVSSHSHCLGSESKDIVSGDDVLSTNNVPGLPWNNPNCNRATAEWGKKHIDSLTDYFANFGLKIKMEETWVSSHVIDFGKKFAIDSNFVPQDIKNLSKSYLTQETHIHSELEVIGCYSSTGVTASHTSRDPIACAVITIQNIVMHLALVSGMSCASDADLATLVAMSIVPSECGGLPTPSVLAFTTRGIDDTITPLIGFLKKLQDSKTPFLQDVRESIMSMMTRLGTSKSLASIVDSPFSLGGSLASTIKDALTEGVEIHVRACMKNPKLLYYASLTQDEKREYKLSIIGKGIVNPLYARALYDITAYKMSDTFNNRITRSTTMRNITLHNKYLPRPEMAKQILRVREVLNNCILSAKGRSNATFQKCSEDEAADARNRTWGRDISRTVTHVDPLSCGKLVKITPANRNDVIPQSIILFSYEPSKSKPCEVPFIPKASRINIASDRYMLDDTGSRGQKIADVLGKNASPETIDTIQRAVNSKSTSVIHRGEGDMDRRSMVSLTGDRPDYTGNRHKTRGLRIIRKDSLGPCEDETHTHYQRIMVSVAAMITSGTLEPGFYGFLWNCGANHGSLMEEENIAVIGKTPPDFCIRDRSASAPTPIAALDTETQYTYTHQSACIIAEHMVGGIIDAPIHAKKLDIRVLTASLAHYLRIRSPEKTTIKIPYKAVRWMKDHRLLYVVERALGISPKRGVGGITLPEVAFVPGIPLCIPGGAKEWIGHRDVADASPTEICNPGDACYTSTTGVVKDYKTVSVMTGCWMADFLVLHGLQWLSPVGDFYVGLASDAVYSVLSHMTPPGSRIFVRGHLLVGSYGVPCCPGWKVDVDQSINTEVAGDYPTSSLYLVSSDDYEWVPLGSEMIVFTVGKKSHKNMTTYRQYSSTTLKQGIVMHGRRLKTNTSIMSHSRSNDAVKVTGSRALIELFQRITQDSTCIDRYRCQFVSTDPSRERVEEVSEILAEKAEGSALVRFMASGQSPVWEDFMWICCNYMASKGVYPQELYYEVVLGGLYLDVSHTKNQVNKIIRGYSREHMSIAWRISAGRTPRPRVQGAAYRFNLR